MTEEPPKPEIDYRDCNYSIDIGDAVKRSLIRHFIRFLDAKIAERGFDPHDEALFDRDQIEAKAWALADEALLVAKGLIDDIIESAIQIEQGRQSASELLAQYLPDVATETARNFLNDELDLLIQLASGHFPEVR